MDYLGTLTYIITFPSYSYHITYDGNSIILEYFKNGQSYRKKIDNPRENLNGEYSRLTEDEIQQLINEIKTQYNL